VPSISDGTPLALIDWDTAVTALDRGGPPVSGSERHILRIAASLAIGHPVSLRHAIAGLDQRNVRLVTSAIRHAAGHRQVNVCLHAADAMELAQLLGLLGDWLAADHGELSDSLERFIGSPAYDVETLRADLANFAFLLGGNDGEHLTDGEIH
jgi:hypothetical protein